MEASFPARTLSAREGELMAWLEAERRPMVTADEVAEVFDWPRPRISGVLAQLNRKGWLRRVAHGHYETALAETLGFTPPNPWASVAAWSVDHYVGFASAAYEHGMTPDRPAALQVSVTEGTNRPRSWHDAPIELIWLSRFSHDGVSREDVRGLPIWIASPERVLIDAASHPQHVGGIFGLARIVARGADQADWSRVVELSLDAPRGLAGARRLAALLDLLNLEVPSELRARATVPRNKPLYLAERRLHGAAGSRLKPYEVVINIDPADLREEVVR
jgi:predicted transcriptional regulator of viral defense system